MNAILKDPLLQLRPMVRDDVADVMVVERIAYPFPWTSGIFLDCLRVGYHNWVYTLGDEILGYAVLSVAVGEAHLLNLCIAPAHQGKGLGRQLLQRMLTVAGSAGADTVFLEVRASNQAALLLYQSVGFNEIGLRRGYYPVERGREDAVVMALSLC